MISHGIWPSIRWPSALIHVRIFAGLYGKAK